MITQRDLAQRLARRNLAGWSVVERTQSIAIADEARNLRRRDHRTRLALLVHQDTPRGRGSARLDIDAYDGSPDELVDSAIALALAAVGPAWTSTPPAAPAKVVIADKDIPKRDLDAVARAVLGSVRRPPGVTVVASAEVLEEQVTIVASSGFHATWPATLVRGEALITAGERSLEIAREARRDEDLGLATAVTDAITDLGRLAAAGAAVPGPCSLVLGLDALLHVGGRNEAAPLYLGPGGRSEPIPVATELGMWSVFAHQADSVIEREGLTRYRWHAEIAPGAAQLAEPLSIVSDGTVDYATRSLPVTDDAVAIRRFALVDKGVAVGLALSPREAGLRGIEPNGGIRNIVVNPGTWTGALPASRTVVVRRLRSLLIDPYTGDASLEVALGTDHRPGGEQVAFTGGMIKLDLIAALARAHRSATIVRRGAYVGPDSVWIEDAEVVA